jgi:putative ABC transport system substrate-binding protein
MTKKIILLAILFLVSLQRADAQQAKVHKVGVILQGGPWYSMVDGLGNGLRELGYEEGKHFILEIRDAKGDLKAVEEAARNLESQKVDLILTAATSVTVATKRATKNIQIVFCAGTDPVTVGLVEAFAKPGGRITGVHFLSTDLTGKRLEILMDMVPRLHNVATFYNPNNPSARESAKEAREAAGRLGVKLIERHATSVELLQRGVRALKVGEADGYVALSDAMVDSQSQLIIDTAKAKRLPTMFYEGGLVSKGGLASYSADFQQVGRLSAKYVQRILAGTSPMDLAVESVHKLELVLNLRTAKEIGLTIPQRVLTRADKVIK